MKEGVPLEGLCIRLENPALLGHHLHHLLQVLEVPVRHCLVYQGLHPLRRLQLATEGREKDQPHPSGIFTVGETCHPARSNTTQTFAASDQVAVSARNTRRITSVSMRLANQRKRSPVSGVTQVATEHQRERCATTALGCSPVRLHTRRYTGLSSSRCSSLAKNLSETSLLRHVSACTAGCSLSCTA